MSITWTEGTSLYTPTIDQPTRRSGEDFSPTPGALPEPGWFPDPADIRHERLWTGDSWTGLTRVAPEFGAYAVAGVQRTMFDRTVQSSPFRTRHLAVTPDRIRWGQYDIRLSDIRSVSYWTQDETVGRWKHLSFSVEGRLGTLRISFKNVRGEQQRERAQQGFAALTSTAQTLILPRLAVNTVNKLDQGDAVKLGGYRLSSRGISLQQREGRRQALSGAWSSLTPLIAADGSLTTRDQGLLRTAEGVILPLPDRRDKAAILLPLVVCLAHDRFARRPLGTTSHDARNEHLRNPAYWDHKLVAEVLL